VIKSARQSDSRDLARKYLRDLLAVSLRFNPPIRPEGTFNLALCLTYEIAAEQPPRANLHDNAVRCPEGFADRGDLFLSSHLRPQGNEPPSPAVIRPVDQWI
jgi:hypothetical protein